jgi:hypothetical protein
VNGGYSNAIKGSPTDPDCDVLANCVGYAYGRFNEIGNYGCCKYLAPVNAENFIQYKGSCEVGQTPRLGACMVWQKGATLSGSDGAGHVAIVEKVVSDTEVYTSESGYGCSRPFWNQTRKKGSDGNWGAGAGYKFLGFIYNPAVTGNTVVEQPQVVEKKPEKVETPVTPVTSNSLIKKGSIVRINSDGVWYNGKAIPRWVRNKSWIVLEVGKNGRIVVNKSTDGANAIMSPIDVKYLTLVK